MAATFALFVLLGLFIDDRVGTRPLFTVVLALLAVTGLGARAYDEVRSRIERADT